MILKYLNTLNGVVLLLLIVNYSEQFPLIIFSKPGCFVWLIDMVSCWRPNITGLCTLLPSSLPRFCPLPGYYIKSGVSSF